MFTSVMLFVGGGSTGIILSLGVQVLFHALHQQKARRINKGELALHIEADSSHGRWHVLPSTIRRKVQQGGLFCILIMAYGLYASFGIAQQTLGHIDPLVFVALQLSLLLPVGLGLLAWTWRSAAAGSIRFGFIGGIPLGGGCVGVALALHTLGIIPTAMLTALDGLIASLISWLILRQPFSLATCLAAICASGGAALLWWYAPTRWQTDLVALGTGLMFTIYAFHVERHAIARGTLRQHLLPFLGGLFCSMSLLTLGLACCFGQWSSLQTMSLTDLEVLCYCGFMTVLVPQVLLTVLLRHMSALTFAFCAVLEPLISLGCAYWWGTIALDVWGWCGVGLILLSMVLHVLPSRDALHQKAQHCMQEPEQEALASPSIREGISTRGVLDETGKEREIQ